MSKWKIVLVTGAVFAIIAMTAVSGRPKKSETELAMFGQAPDGTEDVSSGVDPVIVGTNVWTYSPQDIELYLSEYLVQDTDIEVGGYIGRARVLKDNGPEGGRLDFYFDCSGDDLSTCTYCLIVRFGIYSDGEVVFDKGSMLLFIIDEPEEPLKTGFASFSIAFPADSGGDEIVPEKGALCNDTIDNDGDGLTDCSDPNCKKEYPSGCP